jgi:transcriptional regulator with XRE-family HTH domain
VLTRLLSKLPVPREALRRARENTGMSQQDLATLAGTTVATISDLESGRNREPSHSKVVSIVRALRNAGLISVSEEELFPVALVPIATDTPAQRKRKNRWKRSQRPRT